MKKINIRRLFYIAKHKYLNINSAVILVAFVISANWVWGSLNMMERNYSLQKELDNKDRELKIADLEVVSLELEKRYYQTKEYQELAAREDLGLVLPGEKVLILPASNKQQSSNVADISDSSNAKTTSPNNFDRWLDFLLGRNVKNK